ncbi:hypothetical protein NE237_032603 [Protea cynaroides]|uniref:Uncharacterized protein n=1 Tax=Protea cynaroides TaxID=273540 RepID=A0A9Q0L4A2_9MAGN|nr:hypothetical protein NE237_032603 [Protea cynaroides]
MLRCQGAESALRSSLLGYAEGLRSALRLGFFGCVEVPRCLEEAEKGSVVRFIQSCGEECTVVSFTRLCRDAEECSAVLRSVPRSGLLGHAEVLRCRGAEECSAVKFTSSCRGVEECFTVRGADKLRNALWSSLVSHAEVLRCRRVVCGQVYSVMQGAKVPRRVLCGQVYSVMLRGQGVFRCQVYLIIPRRRDAEEF